MSRTRDEGRGTKEREIRNRRHDPSASLRTRILNPLGDPLRDKFEIHRFK